MINRSILGCWLILVIFVLGISFAITKSDDIKPNNIADISRGFYKQGYRCAEMGHTIDKCLDVFDHPEKYMDISGEK